mgnify:CR=1 FL=1
MLRKPKFWDKNHDTVFSIILIPFTIILVIKNWINQFYNRKNYKIKSICVGNIYLGGTGKTPLCMKIFMILKNLNMKPAFIRKKYESFQDEVDLEKKIGPVYENTSRAKGIIKSIKCNANIAILDDGFQDFSIKKDLSIICFNEKQWIGNGLTIPSGPLRENLSSIKRANCIVINGNRNKDFEKKDSIPNNTLEVTGFSVPIEEVSDSLSIAMDVKHKVISGKKVSESSNMILELGTNKKRLGASSLVYENQIIEDILKLV